MKYIIWALVLSISIIFSVFIHEIGHGISASAQNISVSTGFNKIGDIDKKPSDGDFRITFEQKTKLIKWDLGPLFTLLLAIIFTLLLFKVENKYLVFVIGAIALSNSLLRLIPMVNSYLSLITNGGLGLEDEIGMGIIWYKSTGYVLLKYVPSILSIFISLVCLHYTTKLLKQKLIFLFSSNYSFTLITVFVFIASYKALTILDEYIRINWT